MRKFAKISVALLVVITSVFALIACGGNVTGKYYLYENDVKNESYYIELAQEDVGGEKIYTVTTKVASGSQLDGVWLYEAKGDKITFKKAIGSDVAGTVKNGVITVENETYKKDK